MNKRATSKLLPDGSNHNSPVGGWLSMDLSLGLRLLTMAIAIACWLLSDLPTVSLRQRGFYALCFFLLGFGVAWNLAVSRILK